MATAANHREKWLIGLSSVAWLGLSVALYLRSYPSSPYLLPVIPLGLITLLMAVRHFEAFLYAMVFCVPLSVTLRDIGGGFGVSLPSELLLLLAAVGFTGMILRGQIDIRKLLSHPIGIVILLRMAWVLTSMAVSTHHQISIKFFVAHGTYTLVYYVGFGSIFQRTERILTFFKAHLWGLLPVMVFAIVHLSQYGLSRSYSPVMASPFYDDHTVFGACLAMILPMAGFIALRHRMEWRLTANFNWAWIIFLVAIVALLLSFSRAAWMCLGVIGMMYLMLRLRIPFRVFLVSLMLLAGGAWLGRDAIVENMQQNENVSGDDVLSTAASVTNVSSDDSNKERLNRWACAIRMFQARPWMGFGPGTYEREYGDFQSVFEMTRISTWEGDRGDAHSEYLGVLAEQGIPGLIFLGGLFLMSIRVAMRVIYRSPDRLVRGLATAILLGLSTYYFHGFVNDFLDIDKAAALFWGMLGALAALDLGLKASLAQNQTSAELQKS